MMDSSALKQRQRATWAAGDFKRIGVAQERAAEEGFPDVTWKVGDAEDLPFPDGSFDVVVSSCGLMFAPDQRKAASEVARVTKRGGRTAVQAWTPDGGPARLFKLTNAYVPPPAGVPNPFEWGDEGTVRALFGSFFGDYAFERYDCPEYADSPEQIADLFIPQRADRTVPWIRDARGWQGTLGPRVHRRRRNASLSRLRSGALRLAASRRRRVLARHGTLDTERIG